MSPCPAREKMSKRRRSAAADLDGPASRTRPFDIIGDIHGCFTELVTLLRELSWQVPEDELTGQHPEGRRAVLSQRSRRPRTRHPAVLRLVLSMVESVPHSASRQPRHQTRARPPRPRRQARARSSANTGCSSSSGTAPGSMSRYAPSCCAGSTSVDRVCHLDAPKVDAKDRSAPRWSRDGGPGARQSALS